MRREKLIYGKNAVYSALKSGRIINKILIAKTLNIKSKREIKDLIYNKSNGGRSPAQSIIVDEIEKSKMDRIANTRAHQGVIAWVGEKEYIPLSSLLNNLKLKTTPAKLVMLDGIEDPHNLGAILRTVEGAGGDGVIIPKRRNVGLTAGVAKSSAGAIEYVPVVRVTNLGQTIEILKKEGIWIFGLEKEGKSIFEVDFNLPLTLVVGSEGRGISPKIKEKCDFLISLPMQGRLNSLNASVAVGIAMYEILRKRGEFCAKV